MNLKVLNGDGILRNTILNATYDINLVLLDL